MRIEVFVLKYKYIEWIRLIEVRVKENFASVSKSSHRNRTISS